jgi:hypothetical protein
MRVRLDKTLTSKYSRVDDKFTAIVVDAGPFNWPGLPDISNPSNSLIASRALARCIFRSTASGQETA